MIAMMVFAVYAHDKSYNVPHIDPDPMEFRVKNIKARIDEMETRLNLKDKKPKLHEIRQVKHEEEIMSESQQLRRLLLKGSVS